jgi:calcium-dependent protein kinase
LIFNDNRLERAFKLFDKNGDGMINANDIKTVLGDDKISYDIWENMIKEVDINGDGEISIDEFKQIMMKSIKPHSIN